MTTKLALYNLALGFLNERSLSSLSENREPRRVLDSFYDQDVAFCLGRGFWNFAMRAIKITESITIIPTFGYAFAFEHPADWVRTYMISDNERLDPLLERYNDEASVVYADMTPLYLKYVSNNASYGLNLAAWSPSFTDYVARRLAFNAAPRITNFGADRIELLNKQQKAACAIAAGTDAMDEPPQQPPAGSWARSRGGRYRKPRSLTLGY